jgi:multiple sugar transport system ATP-binding protein
MAKISLKNICKTYDDNVFAVSDFNLEIEDQEFVVLVGPSGCGKSTILRMIAGLESVTFGDIEINGKSMSGVKEKDRDIAMIFQDYALYPHMSVYENIAFGLKMHKVPKNEINRIVNDVAGIMGIEDLLKRKPKALSGGERQRVAMGRAIVRTPSAFLMDEPLSNLDAKLRGQMRMEIAKLHKRLYATIVYVTHDQMEAMTLASRIVVMDKGIVQQIGTPDEIYNTPKNAFVAEFIGTQPMNLFEAKIESFNNNLVAVIGEQKIAISNSKYPALSDGSYMGKSIIIGIRPEDITVLSEHHAQGSNTISSKVEAVEFLGSDTYLHTMFAKKTLVIRNSSKYCDGNIEYEFNEERTHFFDHESLCRIC